MTALGAFRQDVARVQKSYNHLCGIDVSLLIELDVTISTIKAKLRNRLSELKKQYWKRVFDNLDRITNRLTNKNRDLMMTKIFAHQHVDFTVQNAYADHPLGPSGTPMTTSTIRF